VFANVVLADEINRAPPKTQAALPRGDGGGPGHRRRRDPSLPDPFVVIATQNPVEMEGTFELPAAQKDRFIVKTSLGYPDRAGELELIDRRAGRQASSPSVRTVCSLDTLTQLRRAPESIRVEDGVRQYLVDVARATRTDERVNTGVSPRGIQRFFEVVRTHAALMGRSYATPDDVKEGDGAARVVPPDSGDPRRARLGRLDDDGDRRRYSLGDTDAAAAGLSVTTAPPSFPADPPTGERGLSIGAEDQNHAADDERDDARAEREAVDVETGHPEYDHDGARAHARGDSHVSEFGPNGPRTALTADLSTDGHGVLGRVPRDDRRERREQERGGAHPRVTPRHEHAEEHEAGAEIYQGPTPPEPDRRKRRGERPHTHNPGSNSTRWVTCGDCVAACPTATRTTRPPPSAISAPRARRAVPP